MTDFDPALTDVLAKHDLGVLATIKKSGRPQLSVVSYHYDPEARTIRVSMRDGLAKTANLRRDPRATFQVTNSPAWGYAVADGEARLTAVAERPDDETVQQLIDLYRVIRGEHPDWDDYRTAMVREQRLVLTVHVDHVYGAVAA